MSILNILTTITLSDNITTISLAVLGLITAISVAVGNILPAIQKIIASRKAAKLDNDVIFHHTEKQKGNRNLMNQLLMLDETFDRVELWSLSNGESYFANSGVHKWKVSFYDDVVKGANLSVAPHYIDTVIPLTMWFDVVSGFDRENVINVIEDIDKIPDGASKNHFKALGVEGLIVVLLKTSHGKPIGLLVISATMSNILEITDKYTKNEIVNITTRISEHFNDNKNGK